MIFVSYKNKRGGADMNDVQLLRLKLISGFQTVMLVLSMGLLLGLLGWFIGGTLLAMAAMSGVILLYVFNPIISPHLVMKMYRARPLSYHEAPRLHAVVEALAKRAELPGTALSTPFPAELHRKSKKPTQISQISVPGCPERRPGMWPF